MLNIWNRYVSKGTPSRLIKHFGVWKDLPIEYDQNIKNFHESVNKDTGSRLNEILECLLRK
jgi:hypothetical protein